MVDKILCDAEDYVVIDKEDFEKAMETLRRTNLKVENMIEKSKRFLKRHSQTKRLKNG